MKLKKLILIFAMFTGFNAIAQNEFDLGVKGGVSYSGFHSDGSSSYSDPFKYLFGFMSEYKLANNFSIQSELLYIKKTGVNSVPDELRDERNPGIIDSYLTYIDIPINAKYYFSDKFATEFGPQIDILIKEKTILNYYTDIPSNTLDLKTNGLQFSLNLGFSYKIIDKLLLQLRYSHGLSNVYSETYSTLDGKNSVFTFSVGYNFL